MVSYCTHGFTNAVAEGMNSKIITSKPFFELHVAVDDWQSTLDVCLRREIVTAFTYGLERNGLRCARSRIALVHSSNKTLSDVAGTQTI